MQSVFQRTDEGRCNLESVMIGGGPFTYELQQFFSNHFDLPITNIILRYCVANYCKVHRAKSKFTNCIVKYCNRLSGLGALNSKQQVGMKVN